MTRPKQKSDVGTAMTHLNARIHGITSQTIVVPGLESEEEWEAHLEATLVDRAPVGAVETQLVERIAGLTWRMRRVERFECESIAIGRERVEADFAKMQKLSFTDRARSVDEAEQRAEDAQRCLDIIEGLLQMPPDTALASADVDAILTDLADQADQNLDGFMEGIEQPAADVRWTFGSLLAAFKALAARDGEAFQEVLTDMVARATVTASSQQVEVASIREELDHLMRERTLPDTKTIDLIIRYETGLNRMLYQALSTLEAMQSRRAGTPTTLHRVQAYGLPGG